MMHGYDYDFHAQRKLSWIKPILNRWIIIQREYLEEHDFEDSIFWYNERANISGLAGATWRSSGIALEEFSARKGDDKHGRVDLYIAHGNNSILIEAKHDWLYLHENQGDKYQTVLDRSHKNAKKDIKKTMRMHPDDLGLALTFIVPYFKNGKDVDDQIEELKSYIQESNHDLYAWFWNQTGNDLQNDKNTFNFVAMVGDLHVT